MANNRLFIFPTFILCMILFTGCNKKKYDSYQEAARAYDFEAAHKFLDDMNNVSYPPDGITVGDWEERKEEAFDYVFNAEAMYLCAKGDNESINRLTFLLSGVPIKGVAIPDGTEYNTEYDFETKQLLSHHEYIKYATSFNQKCDALIDLAISNHNFIIIEKVLPLFKAVPNPFKEDSKEVTEDQGFRIVLSTKHRRQKLTYSNTMKESAILKINKAIRDGMFPNVTQEIK